MVIRDGRLPFSIGCLMELALIGVAAVLAYFLALPLLGDFHWNLGDALLGIAAAIPLFAGFFWILHSPRTPLAGTRRLLDEAIAPLFGGWSVLQLGVISFIAGFSEEILFRAVVQGKVMAALGPAAGLIFASLLFGCLHCVSLEYALVTAAVGAYLGLLWMASDNLLAPIVTHAVYDFAALVYLLRIHSRAGSEPNSPL